MFPGELVSTDQTGSSGRTFLTAGVKGIDERSIPMVEVQGEIVIDRPPEEVFDFVADEENEPQYNPQMRLARKMTEGPIGVGTSFYAEMTRGRRGGPHDDPVH
jgi:hypothetical protein